MRAVSLGRTASIIPSDNRVPPMKMRRVGRNYRRVLKQSPLAIASLKGSRECVGLLGSPRPGRNPTTLIGSQRPVRLEPPGSFGTESFAGRRKVCVETKPPSHTYDLHTSSWRALGAFNRLLEFDRAEGDSRRSCCPDFPRR